MRERDLLMFNDNIDDYLFWKKITYRNSVCVYCKTFKGHDLNQELFEELDCESIIFNKPYRLHESREWCPFFKATWEYRLLKK